MPNAHQALAGTMDRSTRPSRIVALTGVLLPLVSAIVLLVIMVAGGRSQGESDKGDPYNPRLFGELQFHLSEHYLDPERITPRRLMERAFSALENSVDEIYVENSDPENLKLVVHVDSTTEVFNLNNLGDSPKSLGDATRMLKDVFSFLRDHYTGKMALGDIQYAVANGFLSGLDPHTFVFSPKAFREFAVHIKGEIYGVGMYVGNRDGKLQVIEVLKGTPAQRAGFLNSDIIAKIGEESTINMTVTEAVDKIRGPRHSSVTLTIKRPAADDPKKLQTLPIAVERDLVVIKSVESKLITDWNRGGEGHWSGGVGYVQVVNFDENTTPSLRENLRRLREENGGQPLAGLILDFRGNAGGLLTQAIEMSDYFLRAGDIVSTVSRAGLQPARSAEKDESEPDYPIVVLADESSASGAEIVIGALQKNGRAIVLGTPTFGKGSVQQLYPLFGDAQLKITVSEYLLAGNVSIQEKGVTPDILARPVTFQKYKLAALGEPAPKQEELAPKQEELAPIPIGDVFAGEFDLFPDEGGMTEKDYEQHIVSRFAREETPSYTLQYFHDTQERDPDDNPFIRGDLQPDKDKLVQMALSLLRLAGKPFRPGDLLGMKGDLEKLKASLFQEIVEQLKGKGIDWIEGPNPPATDAKEQVPEAAGKEAIEVQITRELLKEASPDPEDPVPVNILLITARLTNRGDKPLHRVKGISRSEYFLYKDHEFLFGRVEPGKSVERAVRIQLPYFPNARSDLLTLEVSGQDDKVVARKDLEIELTEVGRPRFSYIGELLEVGLDGKAAGRIVSLAPGMEATLKVTVKNTGAVTAHKGVTILRNETGSQIFLKEGQGRIEFKELAPGAETVAELGFEVRDGEPVDEYEFELAVVDSYSGAALTRNLKIPSRSAADPAAAAFPNGRRFSQPEAEAKLFEPEAKREILVTKQSFLQVDSTVRSPDGTPFKAWVTTSNLGQHDTPPDKIFFADSAGEAEMRIVRTVPLRKGINLVSVFAKDQNGLEGRKNLIVRRD